MTMVDAVNQQQPLDKVERHPESVATQPYLPAGKPLRLKQGQALPLISNYDVSNNDAPKPALDEETMRRQVALARAEITGTGIIVDTHA